MYTRRQDPSIQQKLTVGQRTKVSSIFAALAACTSFSSGPARNQALVKTGRHVDIQEKVGTATFCTTCGTEAPVTVEFGAPAKVRVVIPTCYAHAKSKIGDHDHVEISVIGDNGTDIVATAGELDIDDCTSHHVVGKLWATFPDNRRVEAAIDADLVEPK